MKSIHVATPCHRASVSEIQTAKAYGVDLLQRIGSPGAVSIVPNCPWLDCARSDLVAEFLRGPCELLFFRDDDIFIEPRLLRQLVDLDAPIAVAPYRTRLPPHVWAEGGLGCTLVRREAIVAMHAHYPIYDQDGGVRSTMFTHLLVGRKLLKEDQAFYYRAAECGFEAMKLPGAEVTHDSIKSRWPDEAQR